ALLRGSRVAPRRTDEQQKRKDGERTKETRHGYALRAMDHRKHTLAVIVPRRGSTGTENRRELLHSRKDRAIEVSPPRDRRTGRASIHLFFTGNVLDLPCPFVKFLHSQLLICSSGVLSPYSLREQRCLAHNHPPVSILSRSHSIPHSM